MKPGSIESRRLMVSMGAAVGWLLVLALVTPRAEAGALYTIRNLGTLPGGDRSEARGLNNRGQVVGNAYRPYQGGPDTELVGVLFEPDGTVRDKGGFLRSHWGRVGIDASGRVAHEVAPVAFEYDQYTDLNERGQVTGTGGFVDGTDPYRVGYRAILVDGENRVDLGTLGGDSSVGYGINEAGHVVGSAQQANGITRAFLYRDGEMIDLSPALGIDSRGWAMAINDHEQIVGSVFHGVGYEGFLLDGDEVIWLGKNVVPSDLNNRGEVVGSVTGNDGSGRPFLFRDDRVMDLNAMLPEDSGWFLEEAIAINDLGQIAGTGTIDGERRAYLLTPLSDGGPLPDPIPEPGPIAVFGLAAAYCWFRRGRSGR
jgi:probable HAF family extracellular repeat protein